MRRSLFIAGLACLLFSASTYAETDLVTHHHDALKVFDSPALAPVLDKGGPMLFATGGNLYLDDSDKLLDEMQDTINVATETFSSQGILLLVPGQQQPLIEQLKEMDGRVAATELNTHATFALPKHDYAVQIVAGLSARGAGTFVYDPQDEQTMQLAAAGFFLGIADLKSHIDVSMVSIADLGINYARKFSQKGHLTWGATIKAQNISLIERSRTLTEYDESKLFDRNRDIESDYYGNIDLGLSWENNSMRLTATGLNLVPGDFDGPLGGRYHMRPVVKLGADYLPSWGAVELRWDATPDEGFGFADDLQTASLSANYDFTEKLNAGLGYYYIQKGDYDDSVEAKLRYTLGYLFVEVSGRYASTRELGGGIKVQLMF